MGWTLVGWMACGCRRADRLGFDFGVGMEYLTSDCNGGVNLLALLFWIGGTAPGVLLRVLRLWVRFFKRKTRFLVGLVEVVTWGWCSTDAAGCVD